mmetsp:Transcript_46022/g.77385  ORF Transcript_46022/g.77385 Transcript_46022/m.77385 type:complete len:206 (+) Transcript_46022:1206-1823(+)
MDGAPVQGRQRLQDSHEDLKDLLAVLQVDEAAVVVQQRQGQLLGHGVEAALQLHGLGLGRLQMWGQHHRGHRGGRGRGRRGRWGWCSSCWFGDHKNLLVVLAALAPTFAAFAILLGRQHLHVLPFARQRLHPLGRQHLHVLALGWQRLHVRWCGCHYLRGSSRGSSRTRSSSGTRCLDPCPFGRHQLLFSEYRLENREHEGEGGR